MTIGGSGSSYLYGMMDHTYRVSYTPSVIILFIYLIFQDNMPQKECEDLVLQAVTQVNLPYILRPQTN